jgi:hypothetical protein
MEGERYRLEALLALRRHEEEEAKRALARVEEQLARARGRVEEAAREVEQLRRRLEAAREPRPGPRGALQIAGEARFAERCGRELALAREVEAEAAKSARRAVDDANRARAALGERARAREALERHRRQWHAARVRAAERSLESAADDLAGASHHRSKKEIR